MRKLVDSLFSGIVYVLLVLFPVVIINLMGDVVQRAEFQRRKVFQQDTAKQMLESLAAEWRFEGHLQNLCEKFLNDFSGSSQITDSLQELEAKARTLIEKHFSSPFPEHEMWVFAFRRSPTDIRGAASVANISEGSRIIFSRTSKDFSKRSIVSAFDFLVERSKNLSKDSSTMKMGKNVLESLFGKYVQPDTLAVSHRGLPTRTFFRGKPHWFFWNFIEREGRPEAGIMTVVRADRTSVVSGMALSLALRKQKNNGEKKTAEGYGYLKAFSNGVSDVLDPVLEKSRKFRKWLAHFRKSKNFLPKIEKVGFPPEGIDLGKSTLYLGTIPNCTHLALVAFPKIERETLPTWFRNLLFLLTVVPIFMGVAVLFRGFFLGIWPRISLRLRFTLLYALTAAVPLIIASISGYAYIQETKASQIRNFQQEILSELLSVEMRKEKKQREYRTAFLKSMKNAELCEILARNGVKDPRVLDVVIQPFREGNLPVSLLGIVDPM